MSSWVKMGIKSEGNSGQKSLKYDDRRLRRAHNVTVYMGLYTLCGSMSVKTKMLFISTHTRSWITFSCQSTNHFPPGLNPPLPLSPRAPPAEQVDRDDRSSPTVKLLSPHLPGAGSDGILIPSPQLEELAHGVCGLPKRTPMRQPSAQCADAG